LCVQNTVPIEAVNSAHGWNIAQAQALVSGSKEMEAMEWLLMIEVERDIER
jgi:hypothetical protein